MTTETSNKLFHSIIIKAAIGAAREQCSEKNFDKKTVQDARTIAESSMEELSQMLHKIRNEGKIGVEAVSHLSPERITKIRNTLDMKTYKITIDEKDKKAEFKRNGKDLYPAIILGSPVNLNKANDLQIASIVIEAVILVLDITGVEICYDERDLKNAVSIVLEELKKNNTLLQDVEKIKLDKDNLLAMTQDIMVLVINTTHDGIFWRIEKVLLSKMKWNQQLEAAAKINAYMAMIVANEGVTEIAELVMRLTYAGFFLQKLVNLDTISGIKMTLTLF